MLGVLLGADQSAIEAAAEWSALFITGALFLVIEEGALLAGVLCLALAVYSTSIAYVVEKQEREDTRGLSA